MMKIMKEKTRRKKEYKSQTHTKSRKMKYFYYLAKKNVCEKKAQQRSWKGNEDDEKFDKFSSARERRESPSNSR